MHRSVRRKLAARLATPLPAALALLLVSGVAGRLGVAAPVRAPEAGEERPTVEARLEHWDRGRSGVQVLDPLLQERIRHLRAAAPSFDRAWTTLEESGVSVVVGTRDQLEERLPRFVRESNGWAGITVSWDGPGGFLSRSAVAIRVEWLRGLHRSYGNPDEVFLDALDELLIHEIYGHLAFVVERRSARYRCDDPRPGERLADSCVGRRELAVRAERDARLAAHEAAQAASSSSLW